MPSVSWEETGLEYGAAAWNTSKLTFAQHGRLKHLAKPDLWLSIEPAKTQSLQAGKNPGALHDAKLSSLQPEVQV
jgi:hypothetical protein